MTEVQLMGAGLGWFAGGVMHTVGFTVAYRLLHRRKRTLGADTCFRFAACAAALGMIGWFAFIAGVCWWFIDWAGGAK